MVKNTGASFEEQVYKQICEIVNNNEFMVSNPNVIIKRKPRYYSKDRDAEIEFDVSVEKYLGNPDENKNMRPSIIVVIECKDYSNSIPVDDVEEFHAKLQQIGADNTKGMMITRKGCFQKGTLNYANAKGIALARIIPPNQIIYVMYDCIRVDSYKMTEEERIAYEKEERERIENNIRSALTEKDYISDRRDFFFSTRDYSLESLITRFCRK